MVVTSLVEGLGLLLQVFLDSFIGSYMNIWEGFDMALDDIGDYWIELWDTVYALVEGVSDFDETFQGLKYPPNVFSSAYVGAGSIEYRLSDTIGTFYEWNMPIFVLDKDSDITAGKKSVIDLAGKVHAVLVADRSLGLSWLQPIETIELESEPRDAPQGYERQCVKLTLTARAFLDEM